ncbi:hypothetical protein ACHAPT_012910 [Fusarium lateritium]
MAIVAIAGGTGGVGKTVSEHLRRHGGHKFFIIGRKAPAESIPGSSAFLEVTYADVDSLVAILQHHKIDTVVSTINIETDAGSQSQLNLIAAADNDASSGPGMGGWIPNARAIKKTSLEYIRISIGFFLDYWGIPHIKSNLKFFQWFLDMEKGIAVVPGSGDEKFTVTYSEDLARFIVRLNDTNDKWPERGFLSGSDISLNELVAIAERFRGSKLRIVHDSAEKLQQGDVTLLWHPEDATEKEFKPMLAGLCQMIIAEACLLPDDDRRLDKLFPDISLTSVEEIIAKAWGGRYTMVQW